MKNATELGFTVYNGLGPIISEKISSGSMRPPERAVGNEVTLKWNQYYVRVKLIQLTSSEHDYYLGRIDSIEPFTIRESLPFVEDESLKFTSDHIIF